MMVVGALLVVLAAFAFASAGAYYLAAIIVLLGKLAGALVLGIVGGTRLFCIASWRVGGYVSWGAAFLGRFMWGLARLCIREGNVAMGRAHRASMTAAEWLKQAYVMREQRARAKESK